MSAINGVPAGASEAKTRRYRRLTPLGALVFFGLVAVLELIVAPFLQGPRFGRAGYFIGQSPHFAILCLAYALYPQVLSRRFWHFPSNSWYWLIGIAGLETLGFVLGRPVYGPVTKLFAFEVVVVGPLFEEVVRAVTISPMLERWNLFWAVLVTGVLNTAVHPDLFMSLCRCFSRRSCLCLRTDPYRLRLSGTL